LSVSPANEETTYGVTHCKARRARRHGSDWSRVTSSRLAKILAQLALRGADGSGTMHLCEISAEVSGTTGAGIMLQSDELVRGSLCTTDGVAAYLDDLQYTLGEGPSIDAHRLGQVVAEPELASPDADRWPGLKSSALQAGARAMFAFPIRIGAVRLGALTLYRDEAGPIEGDRHTDTLVMTDVAAHTIVAMQANAPPGSIAVELEDGANFHFVVHRAAGMLSEQLGVGVAEALVRLRSYAFLSDTPIDDVAEAVVARRLRLGDWDGT